jgi:23S rRNA-/tRNA-specific pseudouridylate synthase
VEGDFPEFLDATGWLGSDTASVIRKKRRFSWTRPESGDVQDAETHCQCLCRHGGLSLVQAVLVTGRTHQIRATMCSLGFPVVGDKIYGRDETWFLRFRDDTLTPADHAAMRLGHQALHAWQLTVRLPEHPQATWTSPLPEDVAALFPGFAD